MDGPSLERRAELATCLSMTLALLLVALGMWQGISWRTACYMLVGGLGLYMCCNLLGVLVLKLLTSGRSWPLRLSQIFLVVVPMSVALHMAGIGIVILKAVVAGTTALVGTL